MADFQGLDLNTELLEFDFNEEAKQNQVGITSFRLDSGIDFQNLFREDDLNFINELREANPVEDVVDQEILDGDNK